MRKLNMAGKVRIDGGLVDTLQNAQIAVSGLAAIAEKVVCEGQRPEWWSGYHDGVVLTATKQCASRVDAVVDKLVDERDRQDDSDMRGPQGFHRDPRVQFQEADEARREESGNA